MEIKSDIVYCGICRKQRTKTYSKLRGRTAIFVDEQGEEWSGRKCPDCYKQYKLDYDMKRRQRLGHAKLGSSVPCSTGCGNTVTLGNGTHRTCTACRTKKSFCKDCGVETEPGSGSARCPSCWDDKCGYSTNE